MIRLDEDGWWLTLPGTGSLHRLTEEDVSGLFNVMLDHFEEVVTSDVTGHVFHFDPPLVFHPHYTSNECSHDEHHVCSVMNKTCNMCDKPCVCSCHFEQGLSDDLPVPPMRNA